MTDRILCDTELCSKRSARTLEKCLGHSVGWRRLGDVPKEGSHMYVVDDNEAFEVVQREMIDKVCRKKCSAYEKRICKDYCSSKGAGALCNVLGGAMGIPDAVFRRVK